MSALTISGLRKSFGGLNVTRDVNLNVEPGERRLIIGPNGAGKTTLFNVVTGLQRPTRGRVRFRGQDVTRWSPNARARAGMARTFQRLEAFGSLTVRENVLAARDIKAGVGSWFRGSSDRVADRLIERVGLVPYAHQRADSVPTGVARLLEMARALAIEPRLLLLDEPSSGLDEAETENFGELLKDLARDGTSILMVEHDMDLVMSVCEIIHVLEFGAVIATGTPAEIRSNRAVQAAYLGFVDESQDALAARQHLDELSGATMTLPMTMTGTDTQTDTQTEMETTTEFPSVAEEER
jgi:branched-chain amino acid transport system ATP-binding protein